MSAPAFRVAVIGGGQSPEHDVSLASAESAVSALQELAPAGWDVVALTVARDGSWHERRGRRLDLGEAVAVLRGCDVVLPLLHGVRGEDGAVAGLLEFTGIPYVGSGVGAGAIAMDKWVTKLVAQAVGVPTADGVLLTAATADSYVWNRPVVVKPVGAGSSLGVALVDEPGRLRPAINEALRYDDRLLIEHVVHGREIDIAILGRPDGSRVTSPPLEIVSAGFFSYDVKYGGAAEFQVPARLGDPERKSLESAALEVYDALGCRGIARLDFFVTPAGVVLNEVNTTPGFTAQSQVPRMFAAAGVSYPRLLEMLIRDALAAR